MAINKTSKRIGIPGWKTGENSFGAGVHHLHFVSQFGDPVILMPWEERNESVDVIYLPGGPDISPSSYEQNPGYHVGNQDVHKQAFFDTKLQLYIDANVAIFGVCLGMQQLNVKFGGTLTQHLMFHDNGGRWQKEHRVYRVGEDLKKKEAGFEVNSHHHQCITRSQMSDQFVELAFAFNEDRRVTGDVTIVEAFRHKTRLIAGVQWHPEEFYDDFAVQLMEEIVERA